ncbi:anthranilate synthase component I family protein [Sphingobacterium sp. UGAL515B_05]|uniref:anthranilate synthase component I family protein n=1 Tax=Sphingobacterium sp. UGAL515B_05 TaxID=2986767 RepID=UPI002955CFDB|nr:anthranilate synthase component I family protein [Sphingobacterium sp. UGAL515B_05]WON93829.1 anthranilate synthase component I family protein [Sphingobacterium sp. UGAL515B_05]
MRIESFDLLDSKDKFHQKALHWSGQFDEISFFNSNGMSDQWGKFEQILAVKALFSFRANENVFDQLDAFLKLHQSQFIPGFLSYDLKNEIEELQTTGTDQLEFPEAYFFVPAITLRWTADQVLIEAEDPVKIYQAISDTQIPVITPISVQVKSRWTKSEYAKAFENVQAHIHRGDIYEVNLCQEFFAENADISPVEVYHRLNAISPTPFSSFFKVEHHFIMSASPERFLAKRHGKLISQPIKGTAKRGTNPTEDQQIIADMLRSKKEIAENVMIVDLVRNDLTRSALPGTVEATRLFEIQSFEQVHQMISTITCMQDPKVANVDVFRNTFPAGSMTGAPKIAAMQICDQLEARKRGIYAGSIGYFDTIHDEFDFNVVIRSLLYNKQKRYLSFHTGGAVTNQASADQEYQECLLKASAILEALNATLAQ